MPLISNVRAQFARYQQAILGLTGRGDPISAPELPSDPVKLSYRIASTLYVDAKSLVQRADSLIAEFQRNPRKFIKLSIF